MAKILVVDDELSIREFFDILLKKEGYQCDLACNGEEALAKLGYHHYDLVITDISMPKIDGLQVLRYVKDHSPETTVIMITAFASTDSAVEAMKLGAYDYLTKPFKVEEIRLVVHRAVEKLSLQKENRYLKREIESRYNFSNMIGDSEAIKKVYELIKKIAKSKTNILITGESGTGKELIARALHFNSDRKDKPFVTINCTAIPETLLESELFGHLKGSFTGAMSNKMGLFEVANGGTIFLDEMGDISQAIQVKLLRVLQERNFRRVGGTDDISVDVRIISATNRPLEEAVQEGRFREDLYYRLNVIHIKVPPLRNRKKDIPLLVDHFIKKYNSELSKGIKRISPAALKVLMSYDFNGNVRELENIIERSVALEMSDEIQVSSLPANVVFPQKVQEHFRYLNKEIDFSEEKINLDDLINQFERELLLKALEKTGGVRYKAAKLLGITFRSMRYRLKKHALCGPDEDEDGDETEGEPSGDVKDANQDLAG